MRQLSACSDMLDVLTDKSVPLMESNNDDDLTLREQIASQMADLWESFENLRQMAQDIQGRLQENIQTKQAYQDTLVDCEDWLCDKGEKDVALMLEESVPMATNDMDDTQKQLNDVQVFLLSGIQLSEDCLLCACAESPITRSKNYVLY